MGEMRFGRRGERKPGRSTDAPAGPPRDLPGADGVDQEREPARVPAQRDPDDVGAEASSPERVEQRARPRRLAVLKATPTTPFERPQRPAWNPPEESVPDADTSRSTHQGAPPPPPEVEQPPDQPPRQDLSTSAPPALRGAPGASDDARAPSPPVEEPRVVGPSVTQARVTEPSVGQRPPMGAPPMEPPPMEPPPMEPPSMEPPAAERPGEKPPTEPPKKSSALSLNWRSVAALLVALAVAFWIGRGVVGPSGQESGSSTKAGDNVAVPKDRPKQKSVVIDGSRIKAAGAVITLNPALAQPGASLNVAGSGFDGGSTVDVVLSAEGEDTGASLGSFKSDRTGSINAQVTIPDDVRASSVLVTAKQRNSDKIATAEAVTAAGMGFAKLNKTTGKPGDTLSVNARGFSPGEQIKVYWGRASGAPTSTLKADGGGSVSQGQIRVGVGQTGEATLVLVGAKSGTTATVPFYMMALYPTAKTSPYALKAAENLGLSASGFAPEERVLIYVNTSSGPPAMTAKADAQGNIGGLGFKVPFGLKGSQSLVMVGEESRASVSSGFQVLPYTPSAQASTYGGSPGTSLSFFAKDFAPKEVVMVYLGRTKWDPGELVSAFRVNDRGEAGAAGSFQITSGDQGSLNFTLVGRQSQGKATASVKVTAANGPVDLPPRKPYELPPNLRR